MPEVIAGQIYNTDVTEHIRKAAELVSGTPKMLDKTVEAALVVNPRTAPVFVREKAFFGRLLRSETTLTADGDPHTITLTVPTGKVWRIYLAAIANDTGQALSLNGLDISGEQIDPQYWTEVEGLSIAAANTLYLTEEKLVSKLLAGAATASCLPLIPKMLVISSGETLQITYNADIGAKAVFYVLYFEEQSCDERVEL